MPTELKGSCHCGAVKFTVDAFAPVPYQVGQNKLTVLLEKAQLILRA